MVNQINKLGVTFDVAPINELSKDEFINSQKQAMINYGICTEETVNEYLESVYNEAQTYKEVKGEIGNIDVAFEPLPIADNTEKISKPKK